MKPSSKLNKANIHYAKALELIDSLRENLVSLLDDEAAHISFNYGDGFVVVYDGGLSNAAVDKLNIDEFMQLTDKDVALSVLNKASI